MNPEEILSWEPFLRRIPLFVGLSSTEVSRIAARMQLLSLPKGATLYAQGDEGDALYIIASGQVRLIFLQHGVETVAALLGRGEALGEAGLLTGERRTMTVRLDTTCEFLRLSRKEFEEILRENPSILLHLSRMISKRLVTATQPAKAAAAPSQQFMTLNAALEPNDRLLLAFNLGLALIEQTRRPTLVVDMGPDAGALARAGGLKPRLVDEAALRDINLRDPANLKSLLQQHPSGLDILSLPAGVLGGRLFRGLYLFINFLRDLHDLVLVNLGNDLGDVEKAMLSEADWAILAGGPEHRVQFRQLQSEAALILEPKKIVQTWLGEVDPETPVFAPGPDPMVLPWPSSIADEFAKTGEAVPALETAPKAVRAVESLARRLAGLRVGIALGTGAALGHSLIGILKVLKREGIPIDMVAGTSVGSIVAGFYALGLEPEEIETLATKVDKGWVYENLFLDLTVPRSGIFAGQTLLRFLRSYFGTKEFSDLEIPFACAATDIETGEEVVLRSGRVAEAVRASCGLPLIFQPVRFGGRFLVDGGLVDPVPTRVIADMGADILLAVSLTMPAGNRQHKGHHKKPGAGGGLFHLPADMESLKDLAMPDVLKSPNLIEVFFQMIYTMEYEIAQTRTSPAHVVIQPDLTGFSWTELHRAKELIAMGERIAEAYIPQIKSLIPYFTDYCKVPTRIV